MAITAADRLAASPLAAMVRGMVAFWARHRRLGLSLFAVGYVALWAGVSLFPIALNDLDAFFLPSARIALQGHPLLVYSLRYQDVYPNANGPLSLIPLTAAAALAQRLGVLDDPTQRRAVIMGFFALFSLLMVSIGVRVTARTAGTALTPVMRVLLVVLLAFGPPIWHSVLFYGHVEHPILLALLLLAIFLLRRERWALAGVALGLALLTRTSAVLSLLPLFLLLLWRLKPVALIQSGAAALATVGLVLLPLLLADRADVAYSLFGFHELLPVAGGNIWSALNDTPIGAQVIVFALYHDSLVVVIGAALLSVLVFAFRPDMTYHSRDLFALLTLTTLCFPLLVKTLWPYYFFEPFIFAVIWWVAGFGAEMSRRALMRWALGGILPLGIVVESIIGEVFTSATGGSIWQPAWSRIMTVVMLVVLVPLVVYLVRRPGESGSTPPAISPLSPSEEPVIEHSGLEG